VTGTVQVEAVSPAIVRLTIDNPPMNPLGPPLREAFLDAIDAAEADPAVRCLIVTGKGRAFCSGDDLKQANGDAEALAGFHRLFDRLEACRVPVIAAVNGWAIGGGLELALCCDLRIASAEARFVCAAVNVGLIASAYRLPRLIGVARAKAMLLTGHPYDAEIAERYGLVTAVHAPDHLAGAAVALAQRIAGRAPLSIEATKRIANRALDLSPQEGAELVDQEMQVLRTSADHAEALAAFRERRDPVFSRR
jgi:enoyl-CoA hydratase/carnithine racemase